MSQVDGDALPEGIFSLLDTDLYKLTMQCCVLKYFPDVPVTYKYTNRTPHMKFSREAFDWLNRQIEKLANITLEAKELEFLQRKCPYLNQPYLRFLESFRFRPSEHIKIKFVPDERADGGQEIGDIDLNTEGLWIDTILYEIPLLALISETYFKFMDTDWDHRAQKKRAYDKGVQLLQGACVVSEFGSRRRRDYHTQDLVMQGLWQAQLKGESENWPGKLTGTSNVHFAMKYEVNPIGTVAHEWFMGVAAVTNNYEEANELALRYWVGTFGQGVLGIALTDTFGTSNFLKAFEMTIPTFTTAQVGSVATAPSAEATTTVSTHQVLSDTVPPVQAPAERDNIKQPPPRYADVFAGTRQDSGDPKEFVATMREFYDRVGITDKKSIIFSDSLNVEKCFEYKKVAEDQGFTTSFGVGTFLTNDFISHVTQEKSVPLNIVIKLSSAAGHPAIKISDNIGKNTGDSDKVKEVKERLGYHEKEWKEGDESSRWG